MDDVASVDGESQVPPDGEALVKELKGHVRTVRARLRCRREAGGGRHPARWVSALLVGSSPRARYEEANVLITLREALMELIRVLEKKNAKDAELTWAQREEASSIGEEIKGCPQAQDTQRRGPQQEGHLEELCELVCVVERLTIEVAGDSWMVVRLEREREADRRPAAGDSSGPLRWSDVFTDEPDSVKDSDNLERARRRLLDLTRFRAESARRRRADELVRAERLVFAGILTLVLALLLAGIFAWSIYWQGRTASGLGYMLVRAVLAVLAGGLGGALARALLLRDAPLGRFEAARFRRAFWAQITLGGALGVVALMLVEVGALPQVGNAGDAAMVAFYAFLAGWSEPFILNVLNRLGASEDRPPAAGRTSGGSAKSS